MPKVLAAACQNGCWAIVGQAIQAAGAVEGSASQELSQRGAHSLLIAIGEGKSGADHVL